MFRRFVRFNKRDFAPSKVISLSFKFNSSIERLILLAIGDKRYLQPSDPISLLQSSKVKLKRFTRF